MQPEELALSCNPSYLGGYRTVGWLELERLIPPDRRESVVALQLYGPSAKERSTEEVVVSYDENRQDCMLHQQSPEFEPQPDIKISVRPSSEYCNCTKNVINPNKKSLEIFFFFLVYVRLL